MKQITILLAMWCISMSAFAQFEQGRKLVGGSLALSFTTDKTKYDGSTFTNGQYVDFSFDPLIGYFVIDNLPSAANWDSAQALIRKTTLTTNQ
jgi:hypothetical protein